MLKIGHKSKKIIEKWVKIDHCYGKSYENHRILGKKRDIKSENCPKIVKRCKKLNPNHEKMLKEPVKIDQKYEKKNRLK